jgi:hypothetical protein
MMARTLSGGNTADDSLAMARRTSVIEESTTNRDLPDQGLFESRSRVPHSSDSRVDAGDEALAARQVQSPLVGLEDPIPVPTKEQLMQRFGDLDIVGLKGVEAAIGWVMMSEMHMILEAKHERGEYLSAVVEPGEELPQESTFPDGSPRLTSFKCSQLSDGMMEIRVAEMRPGESPLMEARMAELEWVAQRMGQLTRIAEQSPK